MRCNLKNTRLGTTPKASRNSGNSQIEHLGTHPRMESLIVLKRNGRTDSRLQTGWFRYFHEIQSFVVFLVQEILDTDPSFPVQRIPGASVWFRIRNSEYQILSYLHHCWGHASIYPFYNRLNLNYTFTRLRLLLPWILRIFLILIQNHFLV